MTTAGLLGQKKRNKNLKKFATFSHYFISVSSSTKPYYFMSCNWNVALDCFRFIFNALICMCESAVAYVLHFQYG